MARFLKNNSHTRHRQPRRTNQISFVTARTLRFEEYGKKAKRTYIRAEFRALGASTPEEKFVVSLTHTRSGSRKTGMNVPAGQAGLTFKRDRGATGKARARRGVFGGCSSVLRALHKANAHDQFLRPAVPVDSMAMVPGNHGHGS